VRQVDKILVAGVFGTLEAWAKSVADDVIREFEMGIDFDFSELGDARRKMLRMELVRRGYAVSEGKIVRMKSGRFVA
jgi:hypothetical protein